MTVSSIKATALSGALLSAMAVPLSVNAQAASGFETGGVQLNFGVTFGIEVNDNRGFDPVEKQSATEIYTDLSLGILTETRTQSLSFNLGGRLRQLNTSTEFETDNGFVEPSAAFRYAASSKSSRFTFSADFAETDLSDPSRVLDEETGIEIFNAVTSQRRRTQVETAFDWGDDRRFGFGIFARYLKNDFVDGRPLDLSGRVLGNAETSTIGARARFDLTTQTTWFTTLSLQTFEEDDVPGTRETVSLDNVVSIDRPRGPVTLSLNLTETEEGRRIATSVGRVLEMPGGVLSWAIGTTKAATGDRNLVTGNLSYAHDLPRGQLNLAMGRSVASGETTDSERLRNQVSIRYNQDLTPVSAFNINLNWNESEETATGVSSGGTTIGATYSHELTQDWDLNVGIRHRISDSDVSGRAKNNTVFFQMTRAFVTRF